MSTGSIARSRSVAHRHRGTIREARLVVATVLATVLAWYVATRLFDSVLPFLAPWTALLTVQATVYRSVANGVVTALSTIAGVALAAVAALAWGTNPLSLTLAVTCGLLTSRLDIRGVQGATAATTALIVLTSPGAADISLLLDRIVEVCMGATVGVAVNAALVPPLHRGDAHEAIQRVTDDLSRVLRGMAAELRGSWTTDRAQEWLEAADAMEDDLRAADGQVAMTRESARYNPRSRRNAENGPDTAHLERMRRAVAQVRGIVHAIAAATHQGQSWDDEFRCGWTALADECGRQLATPNRDGLAVLAADVDDFARRMSRPDLPDLRWPEYGSLVVGLRTIVDAVRPDDPEA